MKKALSSTIDFTAASTSIGRLGIAATRRGVIAIVPLRGGGRISAERARRLPDVARRAGKTTRIAVHERGPLPPRLAEAVAALRAYAAGERRPRAMRLDLAGTPFQRAVWSRLRGIPSGTTTTYGALAAALGTPQAARAVGSAVGSNPITVLIPCHRVIGSNGTLTGYAWGLPMKRALLRHEGADQSSRPSRPMATRVG